MIFYLINWLLYLTGNGVYWCGWLLHTGREAGHQHEYQNGEEGGGKGGHCKREWALLVAVHGHGDQHTDNIHPCDGGCEAETSNERVKGLTLKLTGNADYLTLDVHCLYTINKEKNYSGI